MKNLIIPAAITAFCVSLAGCGSKENRILAKVDGEVITVKDFNGRIDKMPKQYQDMVRAQKAKFLDDLIIEKLLYKKALKARLDKDRETQEIIAEASKKIIISQLIDKEVEKKVNIADSDVKKYYDEHSEEFMMPERWRASHILTDTAEEAEAVKLALSQGASFEELAKEKSKDPAAKSGGDIGYFSKGQLLPEFEEECFKLKPGEVGNVVKTQFGYHVIKLTDKKNPEVQLFASVKDMIKKDMERRAKKDALDKIIADLKKKSSIFINEKLLTEDGSKGAKPAEKEKADQKTADAAKTPVDAPAGK